MCYINENGFVYDIPRTHGTNDMLLWGLVTGILRNVKI